MRIRVAAFYAAFFALIYNGAAQSIEDFSRFGENSPACKIHEFRCENGQCVNSEALCDGLVDCTDGSDETRQECSRSTCGPKTFRCDYGACVDGDAPCNGIKDCADNSDENLPRCRNSGGGIGGGAGGGGSGGGHNTSQSNCNNAQFKCNNGQCIPNTNVCDGQADCLDRSDETSRVCQTNTCARHLFRCTYGACVDSDAPCNGVPDCADNSDETLPRCRRGGGSSGNNHQSTTPYPDQSGRSCTSSEFKCDNGQCIPSTDVCDGRIDCLDRSDENAVICGSYNCPQHVFRCSYGACVSGNPQCNGKVECADGSDEDRKLCGSNHQTQKPPQSSGTTKNPYITNVPKPTGRPTQNPSQKPTQRPTNPPLLKEACNVPEQPENGQWQLEKSQCPNSYNCLVPQGVQTLDPGTQLVYKCNQGYKLNGTADVFCGRQGKWSATPVCQEIRCPPLSTAAREGQCTYEDNWVSCDSPVLPRTTAQLSCRNSYTQDTTDLTRFDNVKCNSEGKWEPKPIKCISVCGVASTGSGTPLIVNGSRASVADFPWHATLYKAKGLEKQFICGATIIKDNLLVTAAHCVYDEVNKRVDTPSKFYIMAGNVFRDYDYEGHDQRVVKKARIQDIHIVCNYLGLEGNYASDMAILQIDKPFVFSSLVMPICLDTNSVTDQAVLEVGNYGKVPGFGRTAKGESSFILQAITVPYVSLNTCKTSSIASDSERYITIDKFCAGYSNGTSVCDGDSGGGLVFKTDNKWYIRGIVSVGIGATKVGATRTCDSYAYSLYTRVSSHMEWIQEVILRVETRKPAQTCN